MKILTWNVQWCRGIDGRVDPARIVSEIRRLGEADVVCLQEIGDNFPAPRLPGSDGSDQFRQLVQFGQLVLRERFGGKQVERA